MKYERGILIGRDVLADVYRGRQSNPSRIVAMRGLREDFCTEAWVPLFEQAGSTGAQVHHPNAMRVLDVVREQGRPYLVLEALEGETLEACLTRGALREDESLEISLQIVAAVAQAHRQGLAHRHLTASRVFLCRDETAKITDFGMADFAAQLAKAHPEVQRDGMLYRSPEQQSGEMGDARSDIYALGVLMAQMLAGSAANGQRTQNHFRQSLPDAEEQDEKPEQIFARIPSDASERIVAIIRKALQWEPIARFASGSEMLAALQDRQWQDRDAVQDALHEALQDAHQPENEVEPPMVNREVVLPPVEKSNSPTKTVMIVTSGVLMLGALLSFTVFHRSKIAPDEANPLPTTHRATPKKLKANIAQKPVIVATPEATLKPTIALKPSATPQLAATPQIAPQATPKVALSPTPNVTTKTIAQAAPQPSSEESSAPELVIKNPARPLRRARRVRAERSKSERRIVRRVSKPRRVAKVHRAPKRISHHAKSSALPF